MTKNDKIAKAAIEFIEAYQNSTGYRGRNAAIQSEAWSRLLEAANKVHSKKASTNRKNRKNKRIEKYGRYNTNSFFNGLQNLISKSIENGFSKAA